MSRYELGGPVTGRVTLCSLDADGAGLWRERSFSVTIVPIPAIMTRTMLTTVARIRLDAPFPSSSRRVRR